MTGGNSNRNDSARNSVLVLTPDASGDIPSSGKSLQAATGNSIARYEHTSVINPATGKLYIIGGGSSLPRSDQIDVAQIDGDGNVGAFSTAGYLEAAVSQCPAVILGGRLYVFGGNTGTGIATVQHAPINANGTLGTFVTTDAALPGARFDGAAVVYKGGIYVMGGCTSGNSNTLKSVYKATLNGAGVITSWTADTNIAVISTSPVGGPTTGLRRMCATADANNIYVPGGCIDATTLTNALFVAGDTTAVSDWSIY